MTLFQERKELYTVVIRATEMCKAKQGNSRTFTKKAVKAFLKPLKFKSLRIPKNVRMVAYVGFKTEKEMKQSLQKDKSFLGMYAIISISSIMMTLYTSSTKDGKFKLEKRIEHVNRKEVTQ